MILEQIVKKRKNELQKSLEHHTVFLSQVKRESERKRIIRTIEQIQSQLEALHPQSQSESQTPDSPPCKPVEPSEMQKPHTYLPEIANFGKNDFTDAVNEVVHDKRYYEHLAENHDVVRRLRMLKISTSAVCIGSGETVTNPATFVASHILALQGGVYAGSFNVQRTYEDRARLFLAAIKESEGIG